MQTETTATTPTPREVIRAAMILGDAHTDRICPAGLSSATPEELRELVRRGEAHAAAYDL